MKKYPELFQEVLQNLSGKTVEGTFVKLADVLEAFNKKYACEVTFDVTPSTATIVLKKGTTTIEPENNGKYLLKEGSYTYTASNDGYVTKADQALVITNSDEATGTKTVAVVLVESV